MRRTRHLAIAMPAATASLLPTVCPAGAAESGATTAQAFVLPVGTPVPSPALLRFRQDGSADAVLGTMTQFLLFGVGPGRVSEQVAISLAKPKFLRDRSGLPGFGQRVVGVAPLPVNMNVRTLNVAAQLA